MNAWNRMIRVAVLPYSGENPYQTLLERSLSERAVEVRNFQHSELASITKGEWGAFDVIHLHWPPTVQRNLVSIGRLLLYLLRLWRLKLSKVRIVWTIHNVIPHESKNKYLDGGLNRLLAFLADTLICHSRSAGYVISATYGIDPCKIAIIPHGNYIDWYPNDESREHARSSLNIDTHRTVGLFFGAIRPYKGVQDLITAFKSAASEDHILLLAGKVGGGISAEQLESAIGDDSRIQSHFRFIADHEVQVFMNAADYVVFPYSGTLTSGAVILAMSFGVAVLAYDCDSMRCVAVDGGVRYMDANSNNALQDALREIDNLKCSLRNMGIRNKRCAELLSWNKIAKLVKNSYYRDKEWIH